MRSKAVSLKSRGFPCLNKVEVLKGTGRNVKSLVLGEKS